MSTGKQGKSMNSQAREIILRVLEYFQKEKENKGPLVSVEKVRVRVAAACGISEKSIQRIVKQKEEDGIVSTPGKKRPRLDIVNKMDNYERKELPTLNKLVVSLGEAGLFSGSRSSLRRILQSLNFRFKKFSSRGVLLEKPHVVNLRVQFLRNVLTMDWEKAVFLDETWVNANHSVAKGWVLLPWAKFIKIKKNKLSPRQKNPKNYVERNIKKFNFKGTV